MSINAALKFSWMSSVKSQCLPFNAQFNFGNKKIEGSQFRAVGRLGSHSEAVLLSHIPTILTEENVSLAAYDEIESLIQDVNVYVGDKLLVISNGSVYLDTNVLRTTLSKLMSQLIHDSYKGNALLGFPLKQAANLQIRVSTDQLKALIGDRGVPLSYLQAALPHGRSRRSIPFAVASISKQLFKFVLTFINTKINNALLNASNNVMALYVTDLPTQPVLRQVASLSNSVVKEVAQLITYIRTKINEVFDSVIQGRNSTTDGNLRAKRDLEEFWFGDVIDTFSLEEHMGIPHSRTRRDLSTTIGEFIVKIKNVFFSFTAVLNASLKEYITARLNKTVYISVGKLIVSPVVKVFDTVINVILPCTSCTSLG
ncbi:unnamed protein product [Callosobruchus maculatus]|uniref:Uncharacterized protein n=1 Tax=Callosobruchus maculatus TaxID=64391 RepID=A0A653BJJ5_CALMS|nr:unnamed protein product [Callosobruchus maculatus]